MVVHLNYSLFPDFLILLLKHSFLDSFSRQKRHRNQFLALSLALTLSLSVPQYTASDLSLHCLQITLFFWGGGRGGFPTTMC